jgi:uncharacterized membrane protein HdeD (DUF308 family)
MFLLGFFLIVLGIEEITPSYPKKTTKNKKAKGSKLLISGIVLIFLGMFLLLY